MSSKLLFAFHEGQTELAEEELAAVTVLRWERRKVPGVNFVFPKLYLTNVLDLRKLFVLTYCSCIEVFMTLHCGQK